LIAGGHPIACNQVLSLEDFYSDHQPERRVPWFDKVSIQLPFTRYLKQCPKRGQESLLEVRGQGVECRVSRVQGCRKAGLGRDEADFLGRKMTYLYPQGLF
jgi:hypothetical protein